MRHVMVRVAMVEDEEIYRQQVLSYVEQMREEEIIPFSFTFFDSGESFLALYQQDFDLLILDIQLPGINGMELARQVRQKDTTVEILFITAMPQYAVQGYLVNAMGYILKPISYFQFSVTVQKAIHSVIENNRAFLNVYIKNGMLHLPLQSIRYLESQKHKVIIHTIRDDYECNLTMRDLEKMLPPYLFFRCHNCYFVNLRLVEGVEGCDAIIGSDRILISRQKRSAFMRMLASYGER